MNGKSPQEFAASQVYGRPSMVSPSGRKIGSHKSSHSMSLTHSHRFDSHERFNTFENSLVGAGSDLPPSKYTLKSQALMSDILRGGSISQTQIHHDRSQPSGGRVEGTLLLSDEQMHMFEKENKPKAHARAQSQLEKNLIDRLSNTYNSQFEKECNKQFYEQQRLQECTFSPRLFSSIYSIPKANDSVQQLNSCSMSSQFYLKREPDFYAQVIKMKQQYESHLDSLKELKDNSITAAVQEKPKISRHTKQLSEIALEKRGLQETHVVDRLYYEKLAPEPPKDTNTYTPQINAYANSKQRLQRVDKKLYQDAQKRQQVRLEKKSGKKPTEKESISTDKSKQKEIETALKAKKKSDKIFSSRLDREFQQTVHSLAYTKDPTRVKIPETLTYLEVIDILQQLRFVKPTNSEENTHVATQVQRVWNQLSCSIENKERVLVRNLEVFLFAVQNIRADSDLIPFITEEDLEGEDHRSAQLNPDIASPHGQVESRHENFSQINQRIAEKAFNLNRINNGVSKRLPIGSFDENDNLFYSDNNVALVHKQFKDIGENRLAAERTQPLRTSIPQHSFAPMISNTSRKLAQEKRERVIGDLKSNEGFDGAPIDINEILRYQQQLTRYQNEQQKLQSEEDKLRECTFHPQTKDFQLVSKLFSPQFASSSSQNTVENNDTNTGVLASSAAQRKQQHGPQSSTKSLGVHRSIELYSLAKPNNQRRDREKSDIEYERECDECTFSPDISHVKLANFHSSFARTGSVHSHMNSVSSPHKHSQSTSLKNIYEQKGVQKSIDRTKQGRLQSQITKSMQKEGTTFSAKKRQTLEVKVDQHLQQQHAHHKHNRSRSDPHLHSNHKYTNRVMQTSSQKPYMIASPLQDSREFNTNLTGDDSGRQGSESVEFFNKHSNQNNQLNSIDSDKALPPSNSNGSAGQSGTQKTIEEDRVPLLFVDVNIEDGKTARIIVYEGERSEDLANKFAQEHNLDSVMTGRLKDLLDQQINSLLTKIEEEVGSDHDDEEEEEQDDNDDNNDNNDDEDDHEDKSDSQPQQLNHSDNTANHEDGFREENEEDEVVEGEEEEDEKAKRAGNNLADSGSIGNNDSESEIPSSSEEVQLADAVESQNDDDLEGDDNQHHVVYTEDNFEQLTNSNHQGFASHPAYNTEISANEEVQEEEEEEEKEEELVIEPNEEDNPENPQAQPVSTVESPASMTDEQIREMQMQALAATFKNYSNQVSAQEQVQKQEQEEEQDNFKSQASSAFPSPENNTSSFNQHIEQMISAARETQQQQQQQQSQPTPKNLQSTNSIIDQHMRALATTFNNYIESEQKQSLLPNDPVKSVTSSDIENLHLRALATTYQNYSNNPERVTEELPIQGTTTSAYQAPVAPTTSESSYLQYTASPYLTQFTNSSFAAVNTAPPAVNTVPQPSWQSSSAYQATEGTNAPRNTASYYAEKPINSTIKNENTYTNSYQQYLPSATTQPSQINNNYLPPSSSYYANPITKIGNFNSDYTYTSSAPLNQPIQIQSNYLPITSTNATNYVPQTTTYSPYSQTQQFAGNAYLTQNSGYQPTTSISSPVLPTTFAGVTAPSISQEASYSMNAYPTLPKINQEQYGSYTLPTIPASTYTTYTPSYESFKQ